MLPILFAAYGAVFVAEITGDKLFRTPERIRAQNHGKTTRPRCRRIE
jgi:hypothetical protein